jgi:hypothetical protein
MAGVGIAASGAAHTEPGNGNHKTGERIRNNLQYVEYRILGRTGFKVSDIGCGFPGMAKRKYTESCNCGGINFIDSIEDMAAGNSEVNIRPGNQKLSQGITVYHYKDCSHRKGYPGNSFFQGEKVTGET